MSRLFFAIENEINKRFTDIDVLDTLIKKGDESTDKESVFRKDENIVLILKSSLILLLYNTIEGTMNNIINLYFDIIIKNKISIDLLPSEFQDTLYEYHLKYIGNSKVKLKEFGQYDSIKKSGISYDELEKYLHLFSGNLDAKTIREISLKLGIKLPNKFKRDCLFLIKERRNKLAHGDALFSKCMNDQSVEALHKMCVDVKSHLKRIIYYYEQKTNEILIKNDQKNNF